MPKELKVAFLSKRFRTFNKVSHHKPEGSPPPQFLADKVPTPSWWKGGEVLAVFDKIMLEKVSYFNLRPSFCDNVAFRGRIS